eukprot:13816498-Ditylum_brightwellii.AAC.1
MQKMLSFGVMLLQQDMVRLKGGAEVDSGEAAAVIAGGNNKACRGVVDINPTNFVQTVENLSICIPEAPSSPPSPAPKYVEVVVS